MNSTSIAIVIPCYKVAATITQVINTLPDFIDRIIVVDDKCPDQSGKFAQDLDNPKVTVLFHEINQGVGGAVISGYRKAMELGCEIIVKMDGDGQMDPKYLDRLIEPVISNQADYAKGNRFTDFKALQTMPKLRLFGNNVLSFWEKVFSGYWNVMDPTNGYTVIHKCMLDELPLKKISKRYFFESDMLLNLYLVDAVVKDISIPAKYGDENSSLSVSGAIIHFPFKLLRGFVKRIFLKYFVYDFNMASIYILLGIPLLIFGVAFGVAEWIHSAVSNVSKSAGTIMIAALPVILSLEMLLQAINIDINNIPKHTSRDQNEKK